MKTALEHTIHESWLLESWLESESSEDGLESESESRVMKKMTRLILIYNNIEHLEMWWRENQVIV